jgi:hypothetical protein
MKPIRSNELNYLDQLIVDKFRDRRQDMESNIEADTQKQTDKNYKGFVVKLGIKAEMKAFKEAEDKLRKFIKNKESYEFTLSQAKLRAAEKLNEKLNSWSSVRSWKSEYDKVKKFEIKEHDDVEHALKKVCKQETRRYVQKLSKYKVKQDLELLEEQAKNVLYSGRDIKEVWKHLGMTFKASGVPVAAPKDFLQLESK